MGGHVYFRSLEPRPEFYARARAEQLVFSKLMEKYQAFEPFEFIVYSSRRARAAQALYATER